MYDKKGSITRTFFTPNTWKGIDTPSKWKGYFSKTPILFKVPLVLLLELAQMTSFCINNVIQKPLNTYKYKMKSIMFHKTIITLKLLKLTLLVVPYYPYFL